MDFSDIEASSDILEENNAPDAASRASEIARKNVGEARQQGRSSIISKRRFGSDIVQNKQSENDSLSEILDNLKSSKFLDKFLLTRLKAKLSSGHENPEEFFLPGCGDQNLHNLVNIISTSGHEFQLLSVEIVANLSPLNEKSGLKLARAAGPYLITLLSSSSNSLKEASSVALGNLALAGFKVVKVLLHQDVIDRLCINLPEFPLTSENTEMRPSKSTRTEDSTFSKVTSATLYALYHIIQSMDCPKSNPGMSNR